MCKTVAENTGETSSMKNLVPLETISEDIIKILSPTAEKPTLNTDNKSEGELVGSLPQDDLKPDNAVNNGSKEVDVVIDSEPESKESDDVEMAKDDADLDDNMAKSGPSVVVLDD